MQKWSRSVDARWQEKIASIKAKDNNSPCLSAHQILPCDTRQPLPRRLGRPNSQLLRNSFLQQPCQSLHPSRSENSSQARIWQGQALPLPLRQLLSQKTGLQTQWLRCWTPLNSSNGLLRPRMEGSPSHGFLVVRMTVGKWNRLRATIP